MRTVTVGDDEWLLLRKPFQIKFFNGVPQPALNNYIKRNNYCLLRIKANRVTERHWGNEASGYRELRAFMIKKTASLTGKTEREMGRELFSGNKRFQNKTYRKRLKKDHPTLEASITP